MRGLFCILCVGNGLNFCGRGGIRTLGRVAPTSVFKTDALNHSATLPYLHSNNFVGRVASRLRIYQATVN